MLAINRSARTAQELQMVAGRREASTQVPRRYWTDSTGGGEAKMKAQEGKRLAGPILTSYLAQNVDVVSEKW
jgi:hypothetical protein